MKPLGAKWFFEPRALPVSFGGGEFASRSVCMAANLRRSVVVYRIFQQVLKSMWGSGNIDLLSSGSGQ